MSKNLTDEPNEALLKAISSGKSADVTAQLNAGASLENEDPNGDRPLHVGSSKGQLACVKVLIEKGAEINSRGAYGNTALMKAGYWGKYEVLRYLLLKGADLEAQNDDGMTALILSAKDGKFDCVKFLVERSANLEAKTNTGSTAVIVASENGHLEIVKLLAEKGALVDVQDEDLWSALIYAARNGHLHVVVFLANHGANFGLADKKGKRALDVAKTDEIKTFLKEFPARMSADLIRAAGSGNVKAVEEILAKGVSVEIEDANGDRALHAAAKVGSMEVLTLLHTKGADLNSKGMYGNTALVKASYHARFDAVKELRFWGANIEECNDDGMTALILAAQDGKFAVVKYLVEQGSKIDACSLIGWTALMAAVAHTETARYLVDRRALLDVQDDDGWTALQLAARQGAFGTVVLLCESGANTLIKDKNGMTAVDVAKTEAIRAYLVNYHQEKDSGLMGACRSGNMEEAQAALSSGANVEVTDASQERPIHIASKHGNLSMVRLLVQHGADINSKGMYANTALMKASYWGKFDVAKYLQLWGAEMEQENDDGMTALHLASQDGRFECVKYLVEHGAQIETRSKVGWTALTSAASFGHLDVVRYLWFRGGDVNFKDDDGLSPVYFAGRNGHMNVVRFLATAGADMMSKDKEGRSVADVGRTPLIRAFTQKFSFRKDLDLLMDARSGAIDSVREKLEDGANIEVEDVNGDRPIHLAAKNSHIDVVMELFKAGVNVNAKGMYGNTALIQTAYWGKFDVCKVLLQFCAADLEQRNDDGLTALILSSQDGKKDVAKFLIDWGADIEARSNIGWTSLMCAAAYGHLDVVKVLFFKKASFNRQDTEGWTALHLAARNGHTKVVAFLVSIGADISMCDSLGRSPAQVAQTDFLSQFLTAQLALQEQGCIHRSTRNADLPTLLKLIASGTQVDISNEHTGDTPLHMAAGAGHAHVVEALIDKGGCGVDARGWQGETPLHRGAANGHLEVVKKLIARKANVNAHNDDNFTPLSMAALYGLMDMVVFLHENGATLSLPDALSGRVANWSPLSAAASRGFTEVVEYIVLKGGPTVLDVQDEDGWTALHYAARNAHMETVQYLKKAGADLRVVDKTGKRAFEMSKTKEISMLLWYGVDSERSTGKDSVSGVVNSGGQLYVLLAAADNSLHMGEVGEGMKGMSRRLLAEYEAVYELLIHLRMGVLDAGIIAAMNAKNLRLAEALQHEMDAFHVVKRMNVGDYPDRVNVERRLTQLYADMTHLRTDLSNDKGNPRSQQFAQENETAMANLRQQAENCLVQDEGAYGAAPALPGE